MKIFPFSGCRRIHTITRSSQWRSTQSVTRIFVPYSIFHFKILCCTKIVVSKHHAKFSVICPPQISSITSCNQFCFYISFQVITLLISMLYQKCNEDEMFLLDKALFQNWKHSFLETFIYLHSAVEPAPEKWGGLGCSPWKCCVTCFSSRCKIQVTAFCLDCLFTRQKRLIWLTPLETPILLHWIGIWGIGKVGNQDPSFIPSRSSATVFCFLFFTVQRIWSS